MKFDELDMRMRVFETTNDPVVLPGLWMVARLDGRGFTRLTRERHRFEAPFDVRFRDLMTATVEHLMGCGFRFLYAHTHSDEMSVLLHRDDETFGRKLRKLCSVLAGEASGKFSLLLGDVAAFDARVSQLPDLDLVVDYFRWRQEDAHRNALNAHCYWLLRREGRGAPEATRALEGRSPAWKNELLFRHGIQFADLPAWQKRGVGLYWETYEKTGRDPRTGAETRAQRRRLRVDPDLPMRAAYSDWVRARLDTNGARSRS